MFLHQIGYQIYYQIGRRNPEVFTLSVTGGRKIVVLSTCQAKKKRESDLFADLDPSGVFAFEEISPPPPPPFPVGYVDFQCSQLPAGR
jgi:hypothetical protein